MVRLTSKPLRRLLAGLSPLCVLILAASARAQVIVYVDSDGLPSGDGSSWAEAYRFLGDALDDWSNALVPVEIRVGEGVYRPDERNENPLGTNDRTASFQLADDVTLLGGFRGIPAPGQDPNDRDIVQFEAVLSGDLFINDEPPFNLDDNSYHVVSGSGTNATAQLDGFTISSGFANTTGGSGGGMIIELGNPVLNNCTFTMCTAVDSGGALNIELASNPTLIDCTFVGNAATGGMTGSFGGAIAVRTGSSPVFDDCSIANNQADSRGGGLYIASGATATITASSIAGNTAGAEGGGIYSGLLATLNVSGTTICNNDPDNITGPMDDGGGNSICGGPCAADLNGNAIVDFADIFEIIGNWGCTTCPEDLNGNGVVDFGDIFEIIAAWGPCV